MSIDKPAQVDEGNAVLIERLARDDALHPESVEPDDVVNGADTSRAGEIPAGNLTVRPSKSPVARTFRHPVL